AIEANLLTAEEVRRVNEDMLENVRLSGMPSISDSAAEERVLRRVADYARAHHPTLPPALADHLWRTHIIPWTKQVELHHLLHP
ncbi:MAG: hypothetical protein IKO01_08820, partial [Kiritimatiellae bacterium]|nr:hypothetical protein [Kiritimatiellia bacterium]